MPIPPEIRKQFYSRASGWPAVRARILERAQWCCERCGVPDRATVTRVFSWWFDAREDVWIAPGKIPVDLRPPAERGLRANHKGKFGFGFVETWRNVRIVLTISHLNHTPGDDRDENLAAYCQYCHLVLTDKDHHADTRAMHKDERRPLLGASNATS